MNQKTLNYSSALIALSILFLVSCKKTSKTQCSVPIKHQVSRIIDSVLYISAANNDSQTHVKDNIINHIDCSVVSTSVDETDITGNGTNHLHYLREYIYHDSTYSIHYSGDTTYSDSVVLNKGMIESVYGAHSSGYVYNEHYQIVRFVEGGGLFPSYSTCTWDANNNIAMIVSGVDTSVFTYDMDRFNSIGDFFELNEYFHFGTQIFYTRNLTTSIISPSRQINITYQYDSDGRITNTRSVKVDLPSGNTTIESTWISYVAP